MSKKWNMIVDIEPCNNCRGCFLAVKDEHTGDDFPGYSAAQPAMGANWLDIERKERGEYPIVDAHFMPVMCNHCDDAPCLEKGGDAVKKRADGIVIIDPDKAKGRKDLVEACPYGAISWNEELELPQTWIFDAHLLDDGWKETRLEQSCPVDVFKSVKVSDAEMQKIAEDEGLEVLQPELGTKPRVYYKNKYLFDKVFVGGTVVAVLDGVEDCVAEAEVVLKQGGNEVARAVTDTFGEFKIDKLEPGSGDYDIEVTSTAGKVSQSVSVGDDSVYVGVLTAA